MLERVKRSTDWGISVVLNNAGEEYEAQVLTFVCMLPYSAVMAYGMLLRHGDMDKESMPRRACGIKISVTGIAVRS